jgi:hypothetical protein
MTSDKGFPLPTPIDGYPLICVTLRIPDVAQYRQDFLGHIWQLGKWWVWEQSGLPDDTRAKQAAQYWRDLLATYLVIGECPVDCCDDILAAIAALQTQANDQSALQLTTDVTNRQIQSQALRDALEERYDGSPTSINPDAPATDFGAAGDRYEALCAGLTAFVYQFARAQVDSVRAGQVVGLSVIALTAALLIPGLNVFFVVGASIAVLLGLGTIGVSTETAILALTDRAALDAVICFMRDTLKAQGVSQANWDACLNTYPFSVGSRPAIVADFIKATLHDNYLTILNILGEAYAGVIDGEALPDCPCGGPWCHTINLKASTTDIVLVYVQDGIPYETAWTPGVGIEGARPGLLDENIVKLVLPATAVIDTITFTTSSVTDNANALGFAAPDGVFDVTPQALVPGVNAPVFGIGESVDFILFGIDRSGLNRTPIAALESITVTGSAFNPWGSSNC